MSEDVTRDPTPGPERPGSVRWLPLLLGPLLALLTSVIPAPGDLPESAWRLVGLTLWMVTWWLSEAVPLAATALLPIPFMPLLGINEAGPTTASYADPLIFLFLGGFLIAAAMRRWNLHTRIAMNIVRRIGTSPAGIIGGFMLATAFLSMWISNTATAVMMFAVGVSLIEYLRGSGLPAAQLRGFGVALMLGIAYSASIGGVGTLIGTPPNALLAAYAGRELGVAIDMSRWMLLGVPFVILMLAFTWFWLTRVVGRVNELRLEGAASVVDTELAKLGALRGGERGVLVIFVLTALAWIFRPQLAELTGLTLSDTAIGLIAVSLLFVLSSGGRRLLTWRDAESIPWGVLLLFGGGLALASAFGATGLAQAIGGAVSGLSGINVWLLVLLVTTMIVFLTELTSNTATAATFLPIMGAVAGGLGENALLLAIPVAIATSAAFMMPVATPPNAIVFAYEDLKIRDMVRAGFVLNIASITVIVALLALLAGPVFGIEPGVPLAPRSSGQ
ncbi:SLC13 family permease [Deinococcus peraridilitoris]|uniref:Anion transporter n=1 Tax=Deinococcus peraridilitoris (strain DSM 19664 / LMG 22246 / CIP 109416 / KR-200) TaxID=937777 RepID=L0A3N8_DEIPD|nr:DASS family sodium-coupled anion symporter [Deinococcus peraridilitoris]AFZ67802.1 anion transporter [Deinococcus peraridilitoris DSM 19664]